MDYNDGTLVFKDNDWELWAYQAGQSLIWHRCAWGGGEVQLQFVYDSNPHCCQCNERPPNELVGLKELHEWRR